MSLEGKRVAVVGKNAKSVPDEERILFAESGTVSNGGVSIRTKPSQFTGNPPRETCALGPKTRISAGQPGRYTHTFMIYSLVWQNCLACGVLQLSWTVQGYTCGLAMDSAGRGPMDPVWQVCRAKNVISAWKSYDLLLKGYDKPASWKIALWVLCKGIK